MFYSLDETIEILSDKGVKLRYTDLFMCGVTGCIKFYVNVPIGTIGYSPIKKIEFENEYLKDVLVLSREERSKKLKELKDMSFMVDLCGYYIIPPKMIVSLDNNQPLSLDFAIDPTSYTTYMSISKNSTEHIYITKDSLRISVKDVLAIIELNSQVPKEPRTKTEILETYILRAIQDLKLKPLELNNNTVSEVRKYCLNTWSHIFTPPNKNSGYKGNFEDAFQGMKKKGLIKNLGVMKNT